MPSFRAVTSSRSGPTPEFRTHSGLILSFTVSLQDFRFDDAAGLIWVAPTTSKRDGYRR